MMHSCRNSISGLPLPSEEGTTPKSFKPFVFRMAQIEGQNMGLTGVHVPSSLGND